MAVEFFLTFEEEYGNACCGFGNHADATVEDRVLHEAFSCEVFVVARGPYGLSGFVDGYDGADGGGFLGFGVK